MKKIYIGALMAAAITMSATAEAGVGLGIKGGTLGAGLELTAGLSERLNARVGLNQFTHSATGTESHIEYDTDLKLQNAAAILDWHPFKGAFRLSVGYVFNSNAIDMSGRPTGVNSFEINDNTYSLDSLDGEVNFTNGTYVGMGWGNAGKGKGLGISLEIGAFYQGSPDLSLTARGDSAIVNNPIFQADLTREEADAQDDIAEYDWYPVVSLGMTYTF